MSKDIETLERLIAEATQVCATNDRLVNDLKDERARLQAGLSFTPSEALEALRTHARKCIELGQPVTFYEWFPINGAVHAQFDRDEMYPGITYRPWSVTTPDGKRTEKEEDLLARIAKATMFEANVS